MTALLPSEDDSYFTPSWPRTPRPSKLLDHTCVYTPSSKSDDSHESQSTSCSNSDPSAISSPSLTQVEYFKFSYVSAPKSYLSIASDLALAMPIGEALGHYIQQDDHMEQKDHFSHHPFEQTKILRRLNQSSVSGVVLVTKGNLACPIVGLSANAPINQNSSKDTLRSNSPECGEHANDDTAVTSKPSRQVDYLSHNWIEEDIWTSWSYIISKRGEFTNGARLENASWRAWMKVKNNLKTISPESLNWLKACDVTWLYGPLQWRPCKVDNSHGELLNSMLSKTKPLAHTVTKKSILKKRTKSELMLQHSLVSASSLKQVTASIHVRANDVDESNCPTKSDLIPLSLPSRQVVSAIAVESTDAETVLTSSTDRKHIHFNEQVEQCIAIDVGVNEDDDADIDRYYDDKDSKDGVQMKKVGDPRRKTPRKGTDCKIISKLPSTMLKQGANTADQEMSMRHGRSPLTLLSSPQHTLLFARQQSCFYFHEVDNEVMENEFEDGWRLLPAENGFRQSSPTGSLQESNTGLRRTSQGMLVSSEEGIDVARANSIIGRFIDTVRDIAHVVWTLASHK